MKTITFVIAFIMVLSLMTTIHANERKQYTADLFRQRLLHLLSEAKQRGLLYKESKESEEELQSGENDRFNQESNEDNYGRQYVRRKVVGISDNPF